MKISILIVVLVVFIALAIIFYFVFSEKGKKAWADKKAERERVKKERREYEAAEKIQLEKERLEREQKEKEQYQAAENLKENFLKENPYIAISDWNALKEEIHELCPTYKLDDRIVDQRNREFREQQLEIHKEYFDTLLTYPLDQQQRDAIVSLGENVLVTAAAGSGKTSTIVAKTHYLVNKLQVDPRKILVITYTRKAAEELQTRVGVSGVECTTFHKHAIDTIASIDDTKPSICEPNLLNKIFASLVYKDPTIESAFFTFQTVQKTLLQYDYAYKSYRAYIQALSEYGKMAPYRDMDNKICYVKSRQEMEIMVVLTELGLNVRYEEKYPLKTSSSRYRQYKPDFTIHYTQDGKEKVIYLEHYAIDKNGNVPIWFGDGKRGGWPTANREYHEGIRWKKQLHKENGTTLIYTTSADFYGGIISVRRKILDLLDEHNIPIHPLEIEEKSKKLAIPITRSVESVVKLVNGFITLAKANGQTVQDIIDSITDADRHHERNIFLLENLVQPIYEHYEATLKKNNELDFTDCLLQATAKLKKNQIYNYDYILVDEFQDMSMDKYYYLNALRGKKPRTRIFCVGDDWQSIYRFSGSDLSLFAHFNTFNGPTEELKIEATHRFGEPLLQRSSEFILQNPAQKKKRLKADKDRVTHIAFAGYDTIEQEREIIEKQVKRLPAEAKIYILSRYRYDIGNLFPEVANLVRNENGGAIELTIDGRKIQALTAHSSKGLEADYVFLINCNSGYDDFGFPSQVSDDPILEYVLSQADIYKHAEERRLFYVAITRAKRASYVLYDKQYPSLFVTEMQGSNVIKSEHKKVCPRCGTGCLMYVKDGYASNGHFYTVVRCTNKLCDFQNETIFFNAEKDPYRIMKFEDFLRKRRVTPEERNKIHVGSSPDFATPVLLIPCAAHSTIGLPVTLDPRYDQYDLLKFYKYHQQKGDLAICIQSSDDIERLLLTVYKFS